MRTLPAVALALAAALPASGAPHEFAGVPVYPGATQDAATAAICKLHDPAGASMRCFRTSARFEDVVAFYEGQPNLVSYGEIRIPWSKDALFCTRRKNAPCSVSQATGRAIHLLRPWTARMKEHPLGTGDAEQGDLLIRIVDLDSLHEGF